MQYKKYQEPDIKTYIFTLLSLVLTRSGFAILGELVLLNCFPLLNEFTAMKSLLPPFLPSFALN